MAMPENISLSEYGEQVPRCPLEDFPVLWSETPEGVKVIPAKLVKALIIRRDGQEIKPEKLKNMIKLTKKVLKRLGVVPESKKFWDVEFVRHFYSQVQSHDNVNSGRKKYQMVEIDENVLKRLRELKTEVKPVRSVEMVDEEEGYGEQVPRCPLEDFSGLWLKTAEGVEVIPCSVVKALIIRRDGREINNGETRKSMIRRIRNKLRRHGVVPQNSKLWDVRFVRCFCWEFQEEGEGGKPVYTMVKEIDDQLLGQLEVLGQKRVRAVKPVRVTGRKAIKREFDPVELFNKDEDFNPLVRLIELGRQKNYVTLDDVLLFFPEAEQNAGQLDEAFSALLNAGVDFMEDIPTGEPPEDELVAAEEAEPELLLDDYLANIDTDDTIGLYLKEVSRVPLLTATEEVELAQSIEAGRMAREELARGNVNAKRKQELELLINDGWVSREHLIKANARLVISVAKKYMGRGVPFLDLIQEGNIGLIRATKKFDYRRGHKFSTYATWWIRQAVGRAIADQGRIIRIPVHMGDQINRMLRMQHQLTQRLGREPSVEELADALKVLSKRVESMIQVARRPLSLEMPTDDEEDSVLGDFVKDDEASPPDDTATYNLLREQLAEVMKDLPPREVRILKLRYGLVDGQAYTLEEVGRKMGVTRERVRQIEAQALSRLRHPSIRWKLRDYLEK